MTRILVIGGGIVGTTISHELADQGHDVAVVDLPDNDRRPSNGNAGWIGHQDIMPLNSARVWRNLPGWLIDPDGPLTVRPAHALRLVPWLVRFAQASRPSRVAANSAVMSALNRAGLPSWERRLQGLRLSEHLRRAGALSVHRKLDTYEAAAKIIARQREFGIEVERVAAGGLREIEPALTEGLAGGAYYPKACQVSDPKWLLHALTERAAERGIERIAGRVLAVTPMAAGGRVILEGGRELEGQKVILSAGIWSKPLAASLGDSVPLEAERGYNWTFAPGSFGATHPLVLENDGLTTTPLATGDRIGGMVEFGGIDAGPRPRRFEAILRQLHRYLPRARTEDGRSWMGLRPSTPDSLAVLGPSRRSPDILYAFGHGHYGLTQASITAEIIAALIAQRPTPVDVSMLTPRRFGGG
ncbi:D-amino-acid dehydrogenase [Rhodoligotrophos appendicifer]|uniref:NAD(P)/FAD-dependent oxidoreductase n=1 Tax=Rhodoligotrophos appendicifer TaxID=987056 RepID=UPI001184C895|nr:FAD-dependent oxidoreductase [Rhodoligotrophos appendicifer]